MNESEQLVKTIGDLYESIVDESRWTEALRSLSDFAGGRGTFYLRADPRTGSIIHSESVDIDPVVNDRYLEYYAAKEVRLPPSLGIPAGQVVVEDMLIDKRTFQRSEIYADLLLPFDIPNVLMLWAEKTPGLFSAMVIERSIKQGKFLPEECRKFSALVPHLIRALRVRNELQRIRGRQRLHMGMLYSLPFAIILLDQTGRIVESSPVAESLLRAEQGLSQKAGRVRATFPDDDVHLQRAIFKTAIESSARATYGDTVAVKRQNGGRSLSINVIPIRSPEVFASVIPVCMLIVFDPERSPQPVVALIKRALQLTEAEAVLASVLFTGISLREAAEQLRLSINTCKSQLKSIYAKTGCRSHVDLAKMLLMSGIASNFQLDVPRQ